MTFTIQVESWTGSAKAMQNYLLEEFQADGRLHAMKIAQHEYDRHRAAGRFAFVIRRGGRSANEGLRLLPR